jgi:hypothetical protein
MKGAVIHGALLAGALGVAWQTWTRDRAVAPPSASLTVWPAGAVEAVALHGALRDVTVEKRGDYFWATVKKTSAPPPRPAAPDAGMSILEDKPPTVTTSEFPVGEDGDKALARLAPLKALRDLGAAKDQADYGLGEQSDKLTVRAGGASHELVLGARVFGGDDRYALEPGGGHVFVVAGETLRPFDAPEFSLRERKLHGFALDDVGEVALRAGGKERTLVHLGKAAPPPEGPRAPRPGAQSWADAKTPDKPDQTLANFMDRVEQLAPTEYAPDLDEKSLTPVAAFEYRAKGGAVLGTVALAKKPAQSAGTFDYYVKSERTRGLAKVAAAAAAKVEQDLGTMLP